tara:strand:- start:1082 stop:1459 length:378 start_codon:yes stop_codon:yes gene_type:complete
MFIKINSSIKIIVSVVLFLLIIIMMFYLKVDFRFIAIITVVVGYITNIYLSVISLIGMIPVLGPFIIKIFSIPFFWFVNLLGSLTSLYAMKKGYTRDLITHRFVISTFLLGIIIGYILGQLVPFK